MIVPCFEIVELKASCLDIDIGLSYIHIMKFKDVSISNQIGLWAQLCAGEVK